jgi:hypothetical protein
MAIKAIKAIRRLRLLRQKGLIRQDAFYNPIALIAIFALLP